MPNLQKLQALSFPEKLHYSVERIKEWYDAFDGHVCVSFSGGKDSTVLLDIVRTYYPHVPAVFYDTGIEFPEIRQFVKRFDNVIWIKPKMSFKQVVERWGYPVVSKEVSTAISRYRNTKREDQKHYRLYGRVDSETGKKLTMGVIPKKWQYLIDAPFKISPHCCSVFKKEPAKRFYRTWGLAPFTGVMASDSNGRRVAYHRRGGCNAFDLQYPISQPLSIWREEDVWRYLRDFRVSYCLIYDMGYNRTGCVSCLFGFARDPDRFETLKRTHPKLHSYVMNHLDYKTVLSWLKYG